MSQQHAMAHQDPALKPRDSEPSASQSHNQVSFPPTTPDLAAGQLAATSSTPTFTPNLPINTNVIVSASPTTPVLSTNSAPAPTVTFATAHTAINIPDTQLPTPSQSKWRVTPAQKEALLKAFDEEPYPELQKKVQLAEQLGVTTAQISKWFQHRRESLTRLGQFKAQYNRTRRTPEELDVLQTAFEEDRYPTAERLAQLEAQLTGVTAKQIKLWFKHRRKQVQKRNRTSTSPSLPSSGSSQGHPGPAPSHAGFQTARPDLASSGQDVMRTDWRSGQNAGVIPGMQPNHAIPSSAVMQASSQATIPYPFDPHYYSYKGPPIMITPQSQFSDMELMALRGAQAVSSNSTPSQEGLLRLAQMLNRPHSLLSEWFRSQEAVRPPEVMTDVSQQPFMQSPALTDQPMTRPYSGGQASPALQDYRKGDGDIQMGNVPDKTSNPSSTSPKVQNGRDQEASRAFQQLEMKQFADTVPAQKQTIGKNGATSAVNVMPHVPPGVLSTYMYPNGINGIEGGVVMPHQAAAFHAGQGNSAPMLAPLRYMPTNPPSQAYMPPNTVWYHPAQSFPK